MSACSSSFATSHSSNLNTLILRCYETGHAGAWNFGSSSPKPGQNAVASRDYRHQAHIYQIRLGGRMLCVDERLEGRVVFTRPNSMNKFTAPDLTVEIHVHRPVEGARNLNHP
jgi:hypothetical protein